MVKKRLSVRIFLIFVLVFGLIFGLICKFNGITKQVSSERIKPKDNDNKTGEASFAKKSPSFEDSKKYLKDISEISIPKEVSIVGLGEATHGNKEFAQLKKEVFSVLVKNYGYKAFALEGDFGGCQVVNNYILNGTGTAEKAVKSIGYAIYNTKEMVDLVEWMHDYNKSVSDKNKLRFYGFDMQRYDCNKLGLLSYIKKVDGGKYSNYKNSLVNLNDDTVYTQTIDKVKVGAAAIEKIMKEMEKNKNNYIAKSSKEEFKISYNYALCIKENTDLRDQSIASSGTRDIYMAEKVKWILEHEKIRGNNTLFLAGHNAHIDKSSYGSMGQMLSETYKDKYFNIGTDFCKNTFLSRDESTGKRKAFSIENNEGDIVKIFEQTDKEICLLDFKSINKESNLNQVLSSEQRMGIAGEGVSDEFTKNKENYTCSRIPIEAYNAIIFVKNATPSTMLK